MKPPRRNAQETFERDSSLALVRTDLTGSPAFIILDPLREEFEDGPLDEAVVAYLGLEPPHVLDDGTFRIYPVSRSLARKGYGPLVYEAAIAMVLRDHPSGVMPGSQVSPDARRVWERFGGRRDYHVEELPAELGVHGDEVLDVWISRPVGGAELPGLDRALANGHAFLDGLAARRDEAETFVLEAGDSLFQHVMQGTPSTVPFSRRGGAR